MVGSVEKGSSAGMDFPKKIHRNFGNTALVSKNFSLGSKYASFEAV
jgi:hypothetical protein